MNHKWGYPPYSNCYYYYNWYRNSLCRSPSYSGALIILFWLQDLWLRTLFLLSSDVFTKGISYSRPVSPFEVGNLSLECFSALLRLVGSLFASPNTNWWPFWAPRSKTSGSSMASLLWCSWHWEALSFSCKEASMSPFQIASILKPRCHFAWNKSPKWSAKATYNRSLKCKSKQTPPKGSVFSTD